MAISDNLHLGHGDGGDSNANANVDGAKSGSNDPKSNKGKGKTHIGDLVSDYLHRSHSQRPETSTDQLDGYVPSKTLPSTGLKRRTEQWRKEHPEEEGSGDEDRGQDGQGGEKGSSVGASDGLDSRKIRPTPSRHSSHSSLPDTARGHPSTLQTGEGPRGRGPGQHEAEIDGERATPPAQRDGSGNTPDAERAGGWLNGYLSQAFGLGDQSGQELSGLKGGPGRAGAAGTAGARNLGDNGDIHDSPQSEHPPRRIGENDIDGDSTHKEVQPRPPKSSAFTDSLPASTDPTAPLPASVSESTSEKKDGEKQGETHAGAPTSDAHVDASTHIAPADKRAPREGPGEDERAATHDSSRARKDTDELGRYPAVLAGVKKEEAPGNRNEIVLDSRITHMHYHQEIHEENAQLVKGPILTITRDGEAEYLPGETPVPTRLHSHASAVSRASNVTDAHVARSSGGAGGGGGGGASATAGSLRSAQSAQSLRANERTSPDAHQDRHDERAHDPEHDHEYPHAREVDATHSDRAERQQDAYEKGMRDGGDAEGRKDKHKGQEAAAAGPVQMARDDSRDGVWRGAMDRGAGSGSDADGHATPRRMSLRPKRKESRWSSFRDDPGAGAGAGAGGGSGTSTPKRKGSGPGGAGVGASKQRESAYSHSGLSGISGTDSEAERHAPAPPRRGESGEETKSRPSSFVRRLQGTPDRERTEDEHAAPDGESDAHRRARSTSGDDVDVEPEVKEQAHKSWNMLRHRVLPSRRGSVAQSESHPLHGTGTEPAAAGHGRVASAPSAIASVPVTTELMAGQLPVMIMKTWLDRDEDGNRAVPVVLGNLRFRVGDSVGLKADGGQTGKEMFKLECEYGDGAVRWVIYRELRDFLSLHGHYKAANFGTSVPGIRSSRHVDIPDFPIMSIPYLKSISGRRSDKEKPMGKAEYAQASRDALQRYLVDLIRAVIFRPESNRLCKFFELSALTLALAPRGGFQGKAGFLKIPGSNASRRANQPGLSPVSWMNNRAPKWFIIRDSYFVATDGPESSELYEVFLIDEDFHIQRPKRAYRQGMHWLTGKGTLRHRKEGAVHMIESEGETMGVDADNPAVRDMLINSGEGAGEKGTTLDGNDGGDASHHTFFIVNSQRKLKLVARNARQMHQFIVSMERIAASCIWTGRNRFDSFAPLRVNCSAQWLVDGRDYFWNLSRAINMAKESVYIHDWWLSPEIYLRRPGNERYRLDNLLKRKAEEGVKVFVIIYKEVSDSFTPVDSTYAKTTLTNLHPNIMVQRSPSHFQTGTFYWSHHEKLCVIDETIAFMGGLDLCFGRWDTPQHVLTDEDHTESTGPNGPVWHGKDYSNERVAEYSNLDKPFEETFDRSKVPRMPWHDVGVQLVGQPARDLCRHFVQRWNLLIRTKNHKRKMPFLLPPPDFVERELEDLKLRGTCEVQICRSVGPWSMSTLEKVEHSIQNAYIKSIELSEHFVYIENQFFITSTIVDGIPVENQIGDAIVQRIIKAHHEGTAWRACVVIPLLPGYTFPIDSSEASSVRLILECQNRTISRGTNSIYSRLRAEGIDPNDYISFFSLRGWGKFKSGVLTTEQVYIHGKTCIIDDRLALIGSANINERSQRGDRDSELLSVIRDTDMIDGTMAGKPFKVGRFAHTLRMRLMREHVGVDVDAIEEDELITREPIADADEIAVWDPDHEQHGGEDDAVRGITSVSRRTAKDRFLRTINSGAGAIAKGMVENATSDILKAGAKLGDTFSMATSKPSETVGFNNKSKSDPAERRDYEDGRETEGFAGSVVSTLEEKTIFERRPSAVHGNGQPLFDLIEADEAGPSPPQAEVSQQVEPGTQIPEDEEQHGRGVPQIREPPHASETSEGEEGGKELYGAPANATPADDGAPTWDTEREGGGKEEEMAAKARATLRKHLNAKVGNSPWAMPTPTPVVDPNRFHDPLDEKFWKDMWVAVAVHNTEIYRKVFRCIPDDLVTSWAQYKAFASHAEKFNMTPVDVTGPNASEPVKVHHDGGGTHGAGGGGSGGGVVGQEGQQGPTDQSTRADIVDGKPKDSLHVPRAASHLSSHSHSHSHSHERHRSSSSVGSAKSRASSPAPPGSAGSTIVGSMTGSGVPSASNQTQTQGGSGVTGGGGGGKTAPDVQAGFAAGAAEEGERKPSGPNEAFADWEREEMEALLGELRGHLVVYSTRFLEAEDAAHNFLFNSDKILPLPIYN